MEKYLNTPIKEVINKFPKAADILNEYNIGCVPCNVGSCLLKDIVEIHNLTLQKEEELMKKLAGVIYPGKKAVIPKIKRKPPASPSEIKYSPPIKRLVDEHVLIKRLIAAIPGIIKNIDLKSEQDRQVVLDSVDFIRSYADKYHHAKEEEILFKYFDPDLDIIKTMLTDHDTGRNHVKAIVDGVQKQNKDAVIEHLNGCKELLTEHIKKEDEILYPWMDRNLTTNKVGELFAEFNEADEKAGEVVPRKYGKFISELEEMLKGVPRRHA